MSQPDLALHAYSLLPHGSDTIATLYRRISPRAIKPVMVMVVPHCDKSPDQIAEEACEALDDLARRQAGGTH